MRIVRILAVALVAIAAVALVGDAAADGKGKNPAPAGRAAPKGPQVTLTGVTEKDIPDVSNASGTYASVDVYDIPEADAGISVNVKPGGNPEAHMLLTFELKEVKGKDGKTKKVPDKTKPRLQGYVPQGSGESDGVNYTSFTTGSEAKSGVDWSTIKGMVTVGIGSAVKITANGTDLGFVELADNRQLKVFHLKVAPPPQVSGDPAPAQTTTK